jgi:O-antigen/teichoic acid export membrane protein
MPSESNKRIAKNTIYLYIRMLFTMGVGLYTSRVVLATLGIEDFGIYNIVGGVVAMFGFLTGTLAGGTQRFLTFQLGKNDFTELKKTFSVALNTHIILAVIILILAETVGLWFLKHKINIPIGREYAALWVYQFSVFAAILSIIQVPYNASIIAHERMNVYAYVSIVDVSLKLIIVYLLFVSGFDKLITYAILIFIVTIIVMSIYWIYCKKQYSECRFGWVSDKTLYKSMLTFSGWNIFGCGAVIGATQGVNILLNMFFGPVVNAARGVSVQVSGAITSFVGNFQTAVNPQIVKLYATGKMEELYTLLFQNAKFSFCLMWLLLLPVLLKLEIILQLWLVEVPEYTPLFCRLILLQSLIFCIHRPFVMAIHATGKMKTINLRSGLLLLSVLPISYVLLKMGYPAYLPFVVYIIGSMGTSFIELYFLHKWINLPVTDLMKKVYVPIISIGICTLPLSLLANYYSDNSVVSLICVSALSILLMCVSVYYIAFSKAMRGEIINKIQNNININRQIK